MSVYSSPSRKHVHWFLWSRSHLSSSSAIQSWLRPWSNNFHKSFSDYNEAVKLFNEELAAGRVIDKNGVVASMGDDSPVYVPGSTGLKLSKATDVPVSSSLPTPY